MAIKRYLRNPAVTFGIGTVLGFFGHSLLGSTGEDLKEQQDEDYKKTQGMDVLRTAGWEFRNGKWVRTETETVTRTGTTEPGPPPRKIPVWIYPVIAIVVLFVLVKVIK